MPEGEQPPEDFTFPQNGERPEKPQGNRPVGFNGNATDAQQLSPDFTIQDGGNQFSGISLFTQT